MPDVFKSADLNSNDDSVMIPDIPNAAEEAEEQPEQTEANGSSDNIVAEDDDAVTAEPEQEPEPEEEKDPLCYTEADFQSAVSAEREQIKKDLNAQAYRDIVSSEQGKIKNCLAEVDEKLSQLDSEHEAFMNSYRDNLAETALEIAEKVLAHKIDEDDKCLTDLVLQTISSAKNEQWISVKVSDELKGLIQNLTEIFKKPEYKNAEVAPGPYNRGTVMAESPNGVVDASVSEQLKNLGSDLQKIK